MGELFANETKNKRKKVIGGYYVGWSIWLPEYGIYYINSKGKKIKIVPINMTFRKSVKVIKSQHMT